MLIFQGELISAWSSLAFFLKAWFRSSILYYTHFFSVYTPQNTNMALEKKTILERMVVQLLPFWWHSLQGGISYGYSKKVHIEYKIIHMCVAFSRPWGNHHSCLLRCQDVVPCLGKNRRWVRFIAGRTNFWWTWNIKRTPFLFEFLWENLGLRKSCRNNIQQGYKSVSPQLEDRFG